MAQYDDDPRRDQADAAARREVFNTASKVRIPDGENPRAPKNIFIETTGGKEQRFNPDDVLTTIGEGDQRIEVTAGAAYHIHHTHLSGEVPGSTFEQGTTLRDVTGLIEQNFDLAAIAAAQSEGVGPLKEKKFVGTIDTGREQFTTGVATLEQMKENGVITEEQIADLRDNFAERVAAANKSGNKEAQDALIAEFNAKGYPLTLDRRFPGAPVTPFIDSEPIRTSEMAVVIIDHKLITTMTGHHREKLPFSPQGSLDFMKANSPDEYAAMQAQFGDDEAILAKLGEDFDVNSADWLQAAFLRKK